MSASPFARYQRLPGNRRRLLRQAAFFLILASAAAAFLPFQRAISFGSVARRKSPQSPPEDVVWAVEAAARHIPWRTVCMQKGLAAQRMLRSAGVDAMLHYGVRNDPESRRLEAHVWVTVDGRPIIGGDAAAGFASVATFP